MSVSFTSSSQKTSRLLTAALLIVGAVSSSQAMASEEFCDGRYDQASLNQCAYDDYKAADRQLNRTYQTLRGLLDKQDKEQLKQVQLAWIDFRDKACDFENRHEKGGSIYPLLTSSCLMQYTKQRDKQLKGEINWVRETQQ